MYSSTLTSTLLAITALSTLALSAPTVGKRNPDNTCHSDSTGVNTYTISLSDDRSIDQTCGGGILDNVRGRCGGSGAVTQWGCDYNGDTGAIIHFVTGAGCSGGDVAAAILAAGGPQLVCS